MSIFGKKVSYEESWEPILKKYGFSNEVNKLCNISLDKLFFHSTVMTGGFPTELSLKNSYSLVSVYDGNMDMKVGDTSIEYDVERNEIFVRTSVSKEQFLYLFTTSLSCIKTNIEFTTPLLDFDKIKSSSISDLLIQKNCTFIVRSESVS